ncbi:MAG TPA: hypothetical protein DDY21_00135 [Candidatus Moranbacteria bacterium]|nr:hypothetical protein [Candidatus Moranbacteria bacterium]
MEKNKMETQKKLAEIRKDTQAISTKVAKLKIVNDKGVMQATEVLTKIKERANRIEEIRLSYTKPLNDSLKAINADFKGALKPLAEMERSVKNAIVDYRAEIERKRRAEEMKLQEAARKKALKEAEKTGLSKKKALDNMVVPTVERQESTIQSKSGMVKTRMVTKFKIIDESKVPKEYWVIDERKIREAVRGGQMIIAGVEVYQVEELSVY